MADLKVRNKEGKELEVLQFEDNQLGKYVNRQLLRDSIVMYQANNRQGTASTKTRAEVAGSGRKPWRQKGTGRARAGTGRSPLWRKGGVVFGPKPRDFSYSMPKKALRKALGNALLAKIRDNKLHILDKLDFEQPKTKDMLEVLKNLDLKDSTTIVVGPSDTNAYLSARNIQKINVCRAGDLNTRDILACKDLLVTKEAFAILGKRVGVETKGGAN